MPRRHVPLAVLAAAAALTVVPACSTTKAPQQSPTPAPQHGVYEECLIQHGVPTPPAGPPPGPQQVPAGPLPGPVEGTPGATTPPPPPGMDQTTWDNAQKACASLQPTSPTTGP